MTATNKHGVRTLLIPVTCQADLNDIVERWKENGWELELNDTPYPGSEGINASEIGVHAHV